MKIELPDEAVKNLQSVCASILGPISRKEPVATTNMSMEDAGAVLLLLTQLSRKPEPSLPSLSDTLSEFVFQTEVLLKEPKTRADMELLFADTSSLLTDAARRVLGNRRDNTGMGTADKIRIVEAVACDVLRRISDIYKDSLP